MAEHHHEHHDHSAHYKKIWMILLGLLVVSILGPVLEIWWLTLITAFGIAFVKAYLVMKHFMHLDMEKPVVWYILSTSLAFMVLFFAGVSPDVMRHDGSRWENVAAKQVIEHALANPPAEHGGDHGGGEHHEEGGHDGGH